MFRESEVQAELEKTVKEIDFIHEDLRKNHNSYISYSEKTVAWLNVLETRAARLEASLARNEAKELAQSIELTIIRKR